MKHISIKNSLIKKNKKMYNLILAVFATKSDSQISSANHIAHALLLHDTKKNNLVCEIHVGKMITRFNPSQDYFFEDLLWQLNNYCQIPTFEIECDIHYPEPIPIEEEYGDELCMSARESIHHEMTESGFHFYVVNWGTVGVEEKVTLLRNHGVKIHQSSLLQGRIG
jgi:hypothetical protein